MKKIIAIIIVAFAFTAHAQQKIGHINTADLLKKLPAVDTAQAKLQRFAQQLQNQSEALINEYQTKLEYYQAHVNEMTETVKKDKELELQQLENRIKKFQEDAQDEVEKKQKELLGPIMDNVQGLIKDVAKERGYDYILDTSSGVVLYFKDSDDISSFVEKKLGLIK